jgi:hypothetical protein
MRSVVCHPRLGRGYHLTAFEVSRLQFFGKSGAKSLNYLRPARKVALAVRSSLDGVIVIRNMYRLCALAALALVAALAFAAPASAQTSSVTEDQYSDTSTHFSSGGDPSGSATVGSLPFTGLDLGLMGVAAVTLVGGGVLIHRRARAAGEGV